MAVCVIRGRPHEGCLVEPRTADALRVGKIPSEVGTIRVRGAPARGKVKWISTRNAANDIDLPSAQHEVSGIIHSAAKALPAAEGKMVENRRAENISLILQGVAVIRLRVVVQG